MKLSVVRYIANAYKDSADAKEYEIKATVSKFSELLTEKISTDKGCVVNAGSDDSQSWIRYELYVQTADEMRAMIRSIENSVRLNLPIIM